MCHLSSWGPCRMSWATLVLSFSLRPVFLPYCHRCCPERAPQEISCKQISTSYSVSQLIQSKTDVRPGTSPKVKVITFRREHALISNVIFSISSDSVKWYYFLFEIRIFFLLKGELTATIWRNKLFHSHSIKVTHCFCHDLESHRISSYMDPTYTYSIPKCFKQETLPHFVHYKCEVERD